MNDELEDENEHEHEREHENGKLDPKRAVANLRAAANTSPPILKFAKGVYQTGDAVVPIGAEFIVHVPGWKKCVTKYSAPFERRPFDMMSGKKPPDLDSLPGQTDEANWPYDKKSGKQVPPWTLENILPFENVESGEVMFFLTGSWGGWLAVSALVNAYTRRCTREGLYGCPIVKLDSKMMKDTGYGPQPRPHFEIAGWEPEGTNPLLLPPPASAAEETPAEKKAKRDLDDDIPFN